MTEYSMGITTAMGGGFPALAVADLSISGGERFWLVLAGRANSVALGSTHDLRYRIVASHTHPAPWTVTDHLLEIP